jgi:hypothetical protein
MPVEAPVIRTVSLVLMAEFQFANLAGVIAVASDIVPRLALCKLLFHMLPHEKEEFC